MFYLFGILIWKRHFHSPISEDKLYQRKVIYSSGNPCPRIGSKGCPDGVHPTFYGLGQKSKIYLLSEEPNEVGHTFSSNLVKIYENPLNMFYCLKPYLGSLHEI